MVLPSESSVALQRRRAADHRNREYSPLHLGSRSYIPSVQRQKGPQMGNLRFSFESDKGRNRLTGRELS
jgi:hypothetical protein